MKNALEEGALLQNCKTRKIPVKISDRRPTVTTCKKAKTLRMLF
jgi:hypothetical protein